MRGSSRMEEKIKESRAKLNKRVAERTARNRRRLVGPMVGLFLLVIIVVAVVANGTILSAQTGPLTPDVLRHGIQSVTFVRLCENEEQMLSCIIAIDVNVNEWLINHSGVDIIREHTSIATAADANQTVALTNRTVYVITIFYR